MAESGISSKELLKELRSEGKVAWSALSTRAVMAAAVLAYLLVFIQHQIDSSVLIVSKLWSEPLVTEPGFNKELAMIKCAAGFVLGTALSALAVGLIVSLAQSGFLISPRALLQSRSGRSVPLVAGPGFLASVMGIGIGLWLLSRYLGDILLLVRQEVPRVVGMIGLIGREIGKSVIVVALVLAILAWIAVRLRFLVQHRNARQHLMRYS